MKKLLILPLIIIFLGAGCLSSKEEDSGINKKSATPTVENETNQQENEETAENNDAVNVELGETLQITLYDMDQVKSANTREKCWTAINGQVYDLTSFISQHPGGEQAILSLCGTDGTEKFTQRHGGQQKQEEQLKSLKIGQLIK